MDRRREEMICWVYIYADESYAKKWDSGAKRKLEKVHGKERRINLRKSILLTAAVQTLNRLKIR